MAGVTIASLCTVVSLGCRNPLVVDVISSAADTLGVVVFTPTLPVEPVMNILIFPAPSDMKMLLFCVSNPTPVAEPKITLHAPDVIQHPAFTPNPILLLPLLFLNAFKPIAVLDVPVVLFLKEL